MAETFADTEALLALMRGETEAAQDILDEMFPSERAALHRAARELANRSDDRNRCPGCGRYIERLGTIVSVLGGPSQGWHTDCREREVARG